MKKTKSAHEAQAMPLRLQVMIGAVFIALMALISLVLVVLMAVRPFDEVRGYAADLAKQSAGIQTIQEITTYRGKEVYYGVIGKNQEGKDQLVLIPEGSSQVSVFAMEEGVTQTEAAEEAQRAGAKQVERVLPGMVDQQPIWEVKSGKDYYLVSFSSGKLLEKEGV